jgi:hypothetical protein
VVQQLREAFPEAAPYRYAILDRESIFDGGVIAFLKATGLKPKRTSRQAPWQNGTPERWIRSCRQEILDHVITLNEEHLRRIVRDYIHYHEEDRIHDSLDKDTPNRRPVEKASHRQGDGTAAPGWTPPPLQVARSGMAAPGNESSRWVAADRPLEFVGTGRPSVGARDRRGPTSDQW